MYKLLLSSLFSMLFAFATNAQQVKDSTYRATPTIINNLIHTKLEVSFDYAKRYLYGKEWVSIRPHFYPTDSLLLDAKGMEIKEVAIVKGSKQIPLKFTYDKKQLKIHLDKLYTKDEQYTIYINYISKPDELENTGGSAAIVSSKGLYFINPDGKDLKKPIEIWTQGETDANSVWFPTIDKTNQKTTSEIAITVPSKYVTLSNGNLASQKKNPDGTRTDIWKMELPHAPYLFMMAVGDFKIYKDTFHGKEVSYYLEPVYAPYAKQIFGNTPEMIALYEKLLGVAYPWNKYAQIVCRDYVSGAMENTTATLHGEYVHRTDRELLDADPEDYISHELFHQWFGDLVTCENWTNITLNESFADYSEYLWFDYKYGKRRADELQYNEMQNYFNQADNGGDANLVRFQYDNQEDVFDAVSYQKGGRILHMLRNFVGDSAFFKALNLYLTRNAFKTAEVPNLRLAMEEVTGRDLNWFFNQWYYGKGYPILDITYNYDETKKTENVIIKQVQKDAKVFQLSFAIDIYVNGNKRREFVMMDKQEQTFSFYCASHPDLTDVDAEKILLAKKIDHKPLSEFIYGYDHAKTYLSRREAILTAGKEQTSNSDARDLLTRALKDEYSGLQILAINVLQIDNTDVKAKAVPVLEEIIKQDKKSTVRAAALRQLGTLKDAKYDQLFKDKANSMSYAEAGAALTALSLLNPDKAYEIAKQKQGDARNSLAVSIATILIAKANENDISYFKNYLENQSGFNKLTPAFYYSGMLAKLQNSDIVLKGIDDMYQVFTEFKNPVVGNNLSQFYTTLADQKRDKAKLPANSSVKDELLKQAGYAESKIAEIKKWLAQ